MERIRSKELMTPKVLNKHSDADEIASYAPNQIEYIGRGSKWGNPYPIGPNCTREESILKYSEWLVLQPELLDSIDELTGKHLVCFCAPKACHGDILLVLANPPEPKAEKPKKIKRVVTRVKAPVEKPVKRVKPKESKPTGETVRVRVDVHNKPGTRYPEERVIEVPKEDENAALDLAINKSGNWSNFDELWHLGSPSYNKESFTQANDRVRLYYEWKYSYPDDSVIASDTMSGFFAGFNAGRAYAQDQITKEQIDAWKKHRKTFMKLDRQDHTFSNDDDIPY
jgi:hypothetical protein